MEIKNLKPDLFKIRHLPDKKGDKIKEYTDKDGWYVTNLYYYESILSPFITGYITLVSTSDAASNDQTNRKEGIFNSLSTDDQILLKIHNLDFSAGKRLVIDNIQVLKQDSNKQIVQLRFHSKLAVENAKSNVEGNHEGITSEIAEKILTNDLKVSNSDVEPSSNTLIINGQSKRPFEWLVHLAHQSRPAATQSKEVNANPGYFAYETKSGFKFKSIDSLIEQKPIEDYYYDGVYASEYDNSENARDPQKKIASLKVLKNQRIVPQIESGMYASKTFFFNPSAYKFTEIDIDVRDEKLVNNKDLKPLGKEVSVPYEMKMDTGKKYHTIRTSVLDVGGNSQGVVPSKKVEDSAEMYFAATATRYNILFSQKWAITIPCNTSLEAGNTLELEIESLAFCDKEKGGDQKSNGKYIIESLCHYLDIEKSVTSMQLIRDSYGLGNFTAGEGDSKNSLLDNVSKKSKEQKSKTQKMVDRDNRVYGNTFPAGSFGITKKSTPTSGLEGITNDDVGDAYANPGGLPGGNDPLGFRK